MTNAREGMKGRAKEVAGRITGNDRLKNEGKLDRASATVKDKLEGAVERVEGAVEGAKDTVQNKLHRT